MREESLCYTKRTCKKYCKNSKGNKFIKLEGEKARRASRSLSNFTKIAKVTIYISIYIYIFLLFKILSKKYRRNSKNNKFNKMLDLERKKTKEQP